MKDRKNDEIVDTAYVQRALGGASRQTIFRLRDAGIIKSFSVSGRGKKAAVRFWKNDIDEYRNSLGV